MGAQGGPTPISLQSEYSTSNWFHSNTPYSRPPPHIVWTIFLHTEQGGDAQAITMWTYILFFIFPTLLILKF